MSPGGETHLLGVLVTAATKQTLADYLSATIWTPYGMEQSAVWMTDRTQLKLLTDAVDAEGRR